MKKILALILAICMCLALVSCGGGEAQPATEKDQATEQAPVENEIQEAPEPEVKECTAVDFIGMTVTEIEEIYGKDYTVDTYQGALYIMYKSDEVPYAFLVINNFDNAPIADKKIVTVEMGVDGKINDKVSIGMSAAEIEKIIGQSLNVHFDEMFGSDIGAFKIGEIEVVINFDENKISTGAEVRTRNY